MLQAAEALGACLVVGGKLTCTCTCNMYMLG